MDTCNREPTAFIVSRKPSFLNASKPMGGGVLSAIRTIPAPSGFTGKGLFVLTSLYWCFFGETLAVLYHRNL